VELVPFPFVIDVGFNLAADSLRKLEERMKK
jgi:hypothetical protein